MKKSLIFVGMLSIGFAYAQEGNVGINTDQPKATLDIQPNATNLAGTTNEGILAPRLSKTRIANIEASKLTEGTLVYATDDTTSPISAYAGTDTKVAKITEKGYYFYNGTEWVRVQYKDTNDAEWVYDDATKRINLKRSGTLFGNTIFYNKNGTLQNYDLTSYKWFNVNNGSIMTENSDFDINFGNVLHRKTSGINFGTSNTYDMNNELLYVDDTTSSNMSITNRYSEIYISPDNTKNYNMIRGIKGGANHYGTGNAKYLIGGYFDARLERGTSDGYIIGVRATANYGTNKNSQLQAGVAVYNQTSPQSGGTITNMIDVDTYKSFANTSPLTVTNLKGFHTKNTFLNATGQVSITNARGFDYDGLDLTGSTHTVQNNYGLHIGNIAGGTASNYAVYTNKGQIRLGDLADTGATTDRVVTVDANGVLKTGGSIAANNGVQTQTTMECNEDNRGKMNFGRISINSKETDAIGFCMKNGDNQFRWYYIYGGASHTVGTNANFGQGL